MSNDTSITGLFIIGCVLNGLLAVIHIYIFFLESILWRKRAAKVFRLPQTVVEQSAGLAANQGFYNLLLAVGLIWGLIELNPQTLLFFSAAIFHAGIFGVITASPRILFVQVLPALLAFSSTDFGYFSPKNSSYCQQPYNLFSILIGSGLVTAVIAYSIKKYLLNPISKSS